METFPWRSDEAFVISENGLKDSFVQYGGGYAQVSYKGIARSWKVNFKDRYEHELRAINSFLTSGKPFLWTQASPHDSEGAHITRCGASRSSEINGRMAELEFTFNVDVVGFRFAEEARKKFGARDTGVIQDKGPSELGLGESW